MLVLTLGGYHASRLDKIAKRISTDSLDCLEQTYLAEEYRFDDAAHYHGLDAIWDCTTQGLIYSDCDKIYLTFLGLAFGNRYFKT